IAERERIGRDLHDSVIQRLYGAGLAMQAALESGGERLRTAVTGAVDEIDDTIAEIRTVIHDLRRDVAETGRLGDRLQLVAGAQAAALGVPVQVHVVGDVTVEPATPVSDAVIAVIREGIANAHRHGQASHIDIEVDLHEKGLRLEVGDDGVGFDPTASLTTGGYGLKNLRARAVEFGGTFEVDAGPGAGTRLYWRVPLDR
ncbi:MAG TPA: sensor histidine kinase, partial [Acidimicrobiales bacterium]|nr:sensor histidine kinase [Acidimicrobiales bacterium]